MRILLVQPDSNKTCIGFKRLARPGAAGAGDRGGNRARPRGAHSGHALRF